MDNTQAAYEFAAVQIENVATLIRKIASHQAAKASGAKSPTPGSVRRVDDAVQAVTDALGCTFAVDTHNATKTAEGIRELVEAVVALRCNSAPAASEPELDEPDGDREYQEMKGAFEFACDKLGWDYGDGYAEYLDSKKNKPADEPAERAEGVPDKRITKDFGEYLAWQSERDPELKDAIDSAKADYEEIQAEIARRVAELTEKLSQWQDVDDNWMVCPGCGSWCRDLPNDDGELSFCKSCKEVDELTAERDAARAEVEKFKTTDVGTLVADAIRADRESDERECRREIRRLRAEVERLKARQIPDGWEMSGTLVNNMRRIAELEARVADQAKEIERLLRPVEQRFDIFVPSMQEYLKRERNAREAAEAALAELRELIRTHYLMWSAAGASTEWSFLKRMKSCPEDELNAALAEFRKTKEQAK